LIRHPIPSTDFSPKGAPRVDRDLETELKFEIDAAGAKALAKHLDLASLGQTRKLRSVYYDTPETDLRDHGLTLRVRDDGKRRIQTVKQSVLGGSGIHRGEWETVLGAGSGSALSPDLDAAARTPLGEVLSRRELAFVRPAFEVEVKRVTRNIEVDGAIIEIALDYGCARAEDRRGEAGPARALFDLARAFLEVAPLDLSFTTKAARGYALLDEAELAATPAINPPIKDGASAGQAFQTIAGAALAQIAANARVLADARLVEAVHQLRIGVRRLRSALSLFGPMLADAESKGVKAELEWLAGELDAARDLDVFGAEVFQPALKREPELVGLLAFGARLTAAREEAYDRAQTAVGSLQFRALTLAALAWIEAGDWCASQDPMRAGLRDRPATTLAAEEFQHRRRKIVKKGKDLVAMAPAERHKLRIRVKRLRYACGFFESLYSGKAAKAQKTFSAAARDLQDSLGALTDIAFSRDLAVRVAGLKEGADPRQAFAAGALVGQAAAPTRARLKAAVRAHRALDDAEAFW
jgi:triphosphatase